MSSPDGMPDDGDPLTQLDALIARGERAPTLAYIDSLTSPIMPGWLAVELARALMDLGEAGRAIALLAPLRDEGRASTRMMILLGRALTAAGQIDTAIATLSDAAYMDGQSTEGLVALGEAQIAGDALPAAIATLERALRLDQGSYDAHFRLGEAWALLDETGKAARAYQQAINSDARDPRGAALRLAEINLAAPPSRASNAYVRHLFDGYAPRYDTHMTGALAYRGPAILAGLAACLLGPAPATFRAIDLGCGTGLSGAAFRPYCAHLDGVDLSPRMVAAAEASGYYESVTVGDLLSALAVHAHDLDMAIACDTIIYLGDLAPLFTLLAQALKPGGWFFFSAEKQDEDAGSDFEVGPTRRFRHARAYLERLAATHGFEIAAMEETSLRTEKRQDVAAFVCGFRRL
ncbi:MAG: methyltransferase domain-containing protein [Rhizobiales bacterium]|nr:methyltransferase domain-containing protein [Hyphomicrobiales bacterium]